MAKAPDTDPPTVTTIANGPASASITAPASNPAPGAAVAATKLATVTTGATSVPKKTAVQLKAEYEDLLAKVQAGAKEQVKLNARLQEDVKAKLKKHVGDIDSLKEQKRQAYTAWQAQLKLENDAAEHAAAMAKTRADAEVAARAAAAVNKAQPVAK